MTTTPITPPIILTGLPGAGKSKVGRLLAERLATTHTDTDALIETTHGRAITDIFATDGETTFRALEADAIAHALSLGGIISLGGGALTTEKVRNLLNGHTVIYIDVDHDELLRRTEGKTHRPLLADNPDEALTRLRAEREPLYRAAATHTVTSTSDPVTTVVDKILTLIDPAHTPTLIPITGDTPYTVAIGRAFTTTHIAAALRPTCTKILIVHAPPTPITTYAHTLAEGLRARGFEVGIASHPDAEAAKTRDVVAQLWDVAGNMRLGRHDAIIAIGGGATTDMAGFVAATWLRGIDVIQVPTTVLAQVDAAVGGKTGINSPAGKNLIGAFHPPARVIVDLDFLATLPNEDLRAGCAEIIKCGFIRDHEILRIIKDEGATILDPTSPALRELIERAIAVKAEVVGADLKESGLREILNYGHTLAHAIERCENYQWRHGEAVAVGCIFAAELAHSLGLLSDDDVDQHRQALSGLGLPISYSGAPLSDLLAVMASDKKSRAGQLRFVLLNGIGTPEVRVVEAEALAKPAQKVGIDCDH
ncbi:MAG: 3-dehydroquinate synthase [Actinomycetaceae bacterium]|nr:3-dehydroquinate synthase [Actinomycetaceae bacterium]